MLSMEYIKEQEIIYEKKIKELKEKNEYKNRRNKRLTKEIERLTENNQAMQEEMARTWKKLDEKENIIKEVREYIEKNTRWFDSEYAKTYGELCTCAGANDTRLEVLVNPSNLLEILDKVDKENI